jgi:hypothetical protein
MAVNCELGTMMIADPNGYFITLTIDEDGEIIGAEGGSSEAEDEYEGGEVQEVHTESF